MPARPPAAGVVQIVMKFTWAADLDIINRFYQRYSGTPDTLSDTGAAAWAAATSAAWNSSLAPELSTAIELVEVTVTDLSSAIGGFGQDNTPHAGGNSGPATSAGVALIVQEHIERRYRGGHPRQYIGGLPASALSSAQLIDPTFAATFESDYATFRASVAAGCPSGIAPAVDVNVSYYEGFTNHTYPSGRVRPVPNLRATPVVDIVTRFNVNPKIGSQRRRYQQSA